jgi:hypothetical protein
VSVLVPHAVAADLAPADLAGNTHHAARRLRADGAVTGARIGMYFERIAASDHTTLSVRGGDLLALMPACEGGQRPVP